MALALALTCVSPLGHAQTTAPGNAVTGPLVQLVDTAPAGTFDALQRLSAIANQASYNAITQNPNAAIYCNPALIAPSATCNAQQYLVFNNLRVLEQTANELLNNGGPTRYSLNVDDRALGFALLWTAASELNAPGSTASQFASGQISSVASRITALRFGASGFSLSGLNLQQDGHPVVMASAPQALGGGASADGSDIGIASRWGGFVNGAFGWGYREPSVLEDAFAFDSKDLTVGLDYRLTRRLVLGLAAGYTYQRIDFDSAASIADGGIRSKGYSATAYALYEWDGPYLSASAGWQHLADATTRVITYPSDNIAVPSVDATAYGSTDSNALLATFTAGWALSHKAFTFEPYLNADYRNITLAAFHEYSVNNSGADAGQPAGFDLAYASQQIRILDTAVGLRLQYALRPRFGVLVPYVRAEYHHNFDANVYAVSSAYNAIASSGAQFNLPSDAAGDHYYQFAGGLSLVLKHGIQGFVQYQASSGLQYITNRQISGGIRGEF